MNYNDPYFPTLCEGRNYKLQLDCVPLQDLSRYDSVLIITDHSDYDYERIAQESQVVIDTRNATRGLKFSNVVLC